MASNINAANFNTSAAVAAVNHSSTTPNQSHRATRAVSSPGTQIVREESELIAGIPLSPSSSCTLSPSMSVIEPPFTKAFEEEGMENRSAGSNGNPGKRLPWHKPSNGAAESGAAVMGADRWPALSESASVSSKSSSDSPRASSDGPSSSSVVSVTQGSGSALSSSSQKQVSNSEESSLLHSNLTSNQTMPARQRLMKQNVNNSAFNGSLSQPPPQGLTVEASFSPSSGDHVHRSGFVAQSHSGGNDHSRPHNSSRHRNGGLNPRGDGYRHQNYGGRRNQDLGNHDWNGRNFNGKDGHMQPRVVPGLMRFPAPPPLPNTAPFIAPLPVQPFGTPMGFPELASHVYLFPASPPESHRGVPFVAPMSPVFFPTPEPQDHQLRGRVVNQIDYYFSNENLVKDMYLRQNMDDQGWVPIKLIAGFKKVSLLTDNIQLILDALRSSTVVEVQGDKVRKRIDWMRWIMPHSVQFPTMSGQDMLVAHVQNISLDQRVANQGGTSIQEDAQADGVLVDFNNRSQLFSSEGTAFGAQGGPARNSN